MHTVRDKIKFPLCTDSPPTCERSCQQKSPKRCPKVASEFRRTLNVIKKVADLFLSGKKLSARIFNLDPSREHAQTEQEEAAILLISARYFLVYLHSTVACRCLFYLLRCLFSSPVPLGAPVSYFHIRRFFD